MFKNVQAGIASGLLALGLVTASGSAPCFGQKDQSSNHEASLGQALAQDQTRFDRLEALAFIVGAFYSPYTAQEIERRRISFAPDATYMTAVQGLQRGPEILEALKRVNHRPVRLASTQREAAYEVLLVAVEDIRKKLYVSADEEFQHALTLAPDSATLHLAYASVLLIIPKYRQAESECRRSLQLWPDDADAHTMLATSLVGQNRDDEAVPEAREALRIFPRHKAAMVALAMALTRARRYDEAIPVLRETISRTPEMPLLRKHLGVSLVHTGDVDGAIEQLKLFLETSPNDAEGHYYLGAAYRVKGRQGAAQTEFKEAERIDPNNQLYAAVANPEGPKPEDSTVPRPDAGSISGTIYTNQFFGFSYEFPKGWTVLGTDVSRALLQMGGAMLSRGDPVLQDAQRAVIQNDYPLFMAQEGLTKGGAISQRSIQIRALKSSDELGMHSGKEFVEMLSASRKLFQGAIELAGPPEEFTAGGKKFWRGNLSAKVGNGNITASEIAIVEKGYLLLFSFVAPDAAGRDELVDTMQSLRFIETQ